MKDEMAVDGRRLTGDRRQESGDGIRRRNQETESGERLFSIEKRGTGAGHFFRACGERFLALSSFRLTRKPITGGL